MKPYPLSYRKRARRMYPALTMREIGERLGGVPSNTIARWVNPGYAEVQRIRSRTNKNRYRGTCIDCGASTSYKGNDMRAARRCLPCDRLFRRSEEYRHPRSKWTKELIVARMQEWAEVYGDAPTNTDWNPYQARVFGDEERAQRYLARPGYWPGFTTIYHYWGSWNAAVEAAGFVPNAPNGSAARQHGPKDRLERQTPLAGRRRSV